MKEQREGVVEHVVFHNRENNYYVGVFSTEDEEFTFVGTFYDIKPGTKYRITGEFKVHKKYGEQFAVEEYEELQPTDEDGIAAFLASGAIKGIGDAKAAAIVKKFGKDTFRIIEDDPQQLCAISGIGKKTAKSIYASYIKHRRFAIVYSELSKLSIGSAMCAKIYSAYEDDALEIVRNNPYRLVKDIKGISFPKADEISEKLEIPRDSMFRIESGVLYQLSLHAENGSTFMEEDLLMKSAVDLLDTTEEAVREAIRALAIEGEIVREEVDGQTAVYMKALYDKELSIAGDLARLLKGEDDRLVINVDNLLKEISGSGIPELSEEQKKAVRSAFENKVSIITGGPGTGKTTIIKAILAGMEKCGLEVKLAAPTGRAAKRMSEATGGAAKTIHRLLEYGFSEDMDYPVFGRNRENMLEADAVIIDEMSMVDVYIMAALTEALPSGCRLIMVGDIDQLPPVGAGNVLRDLIKSECIETVRLKEIFRQAEESLIIKNAHMINSGGYPGPNEPGNDFFFMEKSSEAEILDTITELVAGRLESYYPFISSHHDIQVLTPQKKGRLGTRNLNAVLQEFLNPAGPMKCEKKFGRPGEEKILREGDRVMHMINDYSLEWKDELTGEDGVGVFNGEMGSIERIDEGSGTIVVRCDGRIVNYDADKWNELELAYAVTVHKSQGSEFPAVIIPMTFTVPTLATRDLLYTAVTRGKKLVVIVGKRKYMNIMIDNDRKTARDTSLSYMLRAVLFGPEL